MCKLQNKTLGDSTKTCLFYLEIPAFLFFTQAVSQCLQKQQQYY